MRRNQKRLAIGMALGALLASHQAIAQVQAVPTQIGTLNAPRHESEANAETGLQLTARDRAEAQMWSLNDDEMARVKLLRLGPRGAFSVPGISPVEILGIHARNDAERMKYAEMFAKTMYADVQRILAFQRAYDVEIGKLTAGQPMINFAGLPKVHGSISAAAMMGVPRSQLLEESGQ